VRLHKTGRHAPPPAAAKPAPGPAPHDSASDLTLLRRLKSGSKPRARAPPRRCGPRTQGEAQVGLASFVARTRVQAAMLPCRPSHLVW